MLAAKGLIALHRLIKGGNDDSPGAESVRNALDAPLNALNATEKERAQWLSEDLYSVSEPPIGSLKPMNPQAQRHLNEAIEARERREWDLALALLRRWKEYISPALLSYLRGSIWREAGIVDVAAAFYEHAALCDPENANYRAVYMHVLAESDPNAAARLADEVLADDEKHAPMVVARATQIRFQKTKTASDAEATRLYRELLSILERNMTRIENGEATESLSSDYAMTAGLLGFCHEFLGNSGAAIDAYSRGLQANPNNYSLLIARAILLYGASARSITDFEHAARSGYPFLWPYLFLAHHYLISNRFEQCRAMCETGIKMPGSDAARSQLEEWRAIAQAELGFSAEAVRAAFEAAIRLDPSNEQARQNLVAFEVSLKTPSAAHRATWQHKPEAALKQFGLVERRYSMAA
jgi:tetratricopeptide (TPR) repeat protein